MKKRHYALAAGLAAGLGFLVPWEVPQGCTQHRRDSAPAEQHKPPAEHYKIRDTGAYAPAPVLDAGASSRRDALNGLLARLYAGSSPASGGEGILSPFSPSLPQGYRLEESIPLGDESLEELSELFHDDCVGRCLYINDGSGMVTKVRAPESDQPLEWYDEVSNCIRFTGEFWLYLEEESGTIKAWGTNQGSKTGATRLALPCE